MQLVVQPDGTVRCLYAESIDLLSLGAASMVRASHVEPTESGQWFADLAPQSGPRLGPFASRSLALAAEHDWLVANWLLSTR